jgi:ribonuclease BN (tRNA processing enzyme)
MGGEERLDITFLGSGNAFGPEGRAFSSFLLNGRYLFDCGPTVLQQLQKARVSSRQIEAVVISHFHGDHFFGLPFLVLDGWHEGRTEELQIIGPPGIRQRAESLLELAFPRMGERVGFQRTYIEVSDAVSASVGGLRLTPARVEHVPSLECFAYRVELGGKTLVFSGDSQLCDALLDLVVGAGVLVLECSCAGERVHLSPGDIAALVERAGPQAQTIVTHLDAVEHPEGFRGLHVASDLARFSF